MEEILEKVKKGDNKAFEEIINIVYKKLYVIAKSRLMDEEEAKEVVWESLTTCYSKIKHLKDLQKFNAWIIKIVINNCNKIIKKRKIREVSFEYENIDNCLVLDSEYVEIEDNIDFFEILSILDCDERTIMAMYYSDDYTTKEISEILNINENTIRSKIKRAKQKIKLKYNRSDKSESKYR